MISSFEPEVTQQIIKGISDEIMTAVSYSVVSKTADKIVFKDDSNGEVSTYTRNKGSEFSKLRNLKVKQNFDVFFSDPKRVKENESDLVGEQMRRLSLSLLASDQFKSAPSLPTFSNRPDGVSTLRDRREILDRLLCAYLVNFWVILPDKDMPSRNLLGLIKEFSLANKLTKVEKEILAMSREKAHEAHFNNVGWRMENMMALAWVLGMDTCPDITHGLSGDDEAEELMPFISKEVKALKAGKPLTTMRTKREVAQLEDVFYCAHNAVRSAQIAKEGDKPTVPEGFHPVRNGGVIHEKRHSLTWALSPGVKWDDTDLSS